jgi:nucleoside-diphosphate-sugar epimerase
MKVLVTGGAGYLGTTLIPTLQDHGYEVTVFDSLVYGGDALLPFFTDVNFHFIKGDIRDLRAVKDAVKGQDLVVHLASLVGVPACNKDVLTTQQINVQGTENILRAIGAKHSQRVVYSSTVSVYGKSVKKMCSELSDVDPQSMYGKTKYHAEQMMLHSDATCLRFGTVYGLSPRMRLDLVINELTYSAVKDGYMMVYEPTFIRPWVSVRDAARSIVWALDTHKTNNIYNVVGENLDKKTVAEIIQQETGASIYKAQGSDADMRDYAVQSSKIKNAGFQFMDTVGMGVKQMVRAFSALSVTNKYKNS